MDRSTTSWTSHGDGAPDGSGHRPDEPGAPTPGRGTDPAPNPPRRRIRTPRPKRAATRPCVDCSGADAVADAFETLLGFEPLDVLVVGEDGAARRAWIGVSIDCATGAVVDAHLEFHR
ncbi:hypothetical protein QO001_003186 [Methylobacterium brachiatum]|jgi:hypothetical protein|uniref:Uncharacterized protein n=1 Tax=Methylobacterium brachiatum TaxID=269660 RepID=A0AAJ1TNF0_9HYPH|nr:MULTISPECIES: hypothetical protein [Methylobacterium]MCB4801540.1 hypothetical protein [Methylobacterium brachiatum]MCJ2086137.1 hypothetical protein [Methylobacterium sp. E-005]MDQ0544252.1 hypothetical protein [Methylobacterium brachiatum]